MMNPSGKTQASFLSNDLLEKIDVKTLLYPLWLNKWLVAFVTAFFLLLGSFYAHLKVPLYSSNLLLQLEESDNLMGIDKFSSTGALFPSKGSSRADVQTALIKSRYILEPVVRRLNLDLDIRPVYFPVFGEWYARKHGEAGDKPWWGISQYAWGNEKLAISQFMVPAALEKKRFTLIVQPNNGYELYDATNQFILKGSIGKIAKADIPGMGQVILQIQNIDAGINTHFYVVKKSTQQIIDQLARTIQINDLSQEMQLRNDTGILKISMVGTEPNRIITILNTVSQMVVEKNAEKKLKETTKTLAFLNEQLPITRKSLAQAETALNRYLAKEGMLDLNSESKLLISQIADTQKQLNIVKMNKVMALQKYTDEHPFIIGFGEKEKILQGEIKSLQKKVSELPARDQTAVSLMREVRVKNQLYITLLNKIQSLQVVKGGAISDLTILGMATYPDGPLPAGTANILLFSLLLGLILGSSIIYVQQLWNGKITDPAMIENRFGLTNMAIIPYSDTQSRHLIAHDSKHRLLPLLAQANPKDMSIEALRNLRTSAQFIMMDTVNNIITITGISPGVGKSFVSANFAYLQADAGKKVLLIDGDIRKGHLKDYFNFKQTRGLSEVICGSCPLEDALIAGPIPNLDFLAAGLYPPNPSELLMSRRLKELLDRVSQSYDLVIIDTAPILAVTDAAVIAHHAGTNFLVLASNTHEAEEIDLALKRFHANGVKINGVVFNFAKQQKSFYRQPDIYKYQYQYEYK